MHAVTHKMSATTTQLITLRQAKRPLPITLSLFQAQEEHEDKYNADARTLCREMGSCPYCELIVGARYPWC